MTSLPPHLPDQCSTHADCPWANEMAANFLGPPPFTQCLVWIPVAVLIMACDLQSYFNILCYV